MTAYKQIASALIAGMTLCGCATTKPPASAATVNDSSCLKETGSRIPLGPGKCRGFGRSYSSQDIERTGVVTSAADALALLDPSITVRH
jgi:hypothetical protein